MNAPNRIRALLALRGWGALDLSAATGYARSTVDSHLSGRFSMTARGRGRDKGDPLPIQVYARVLGVPVALLTGPAAWAVDGVALEQPSRLAGHGGPQCGHGVSGDCADCDYERPSL